MSEHQKQDVVATKAGLALNTTKSRHFKLGPKIWGIGSAVLVVLILLVGGVYTMARHRSDTQKQTAGVPKVQPLSLDQQASKLVSGGNYAAAQNLYAKQIAKTKDPATKADMYRDQSSLALNNNNDIVTARMYALKAENAQPSAATAQLLGQIATDSGDKQAAQMYFNQAISRLNPKASGYNLTLAGYQSELQAVAQ